MHASYADYVGPRRRAHHHHRHAPRPARRRGVDLVHDRTRRALRGPAHVQGDVLGPGPGGPGGHHRGGRARPAAPGAATSAPRCSCSSRAGAQNGYQLIQEIERRTDGVWKPSPGSVYPALQQLEDEGLVRAVEFEGKRAYELSDEGRTYVDEHREELGDPFAAATGGVDENVMDMRGLLLQVGAAAMQVVAAGHTEEAKRILAETRRALYKVLAEDEPTD